MVRLPPHASSLVFGQILRLYSFNDRTGSVRIAAMTSAINEHLISRLAGSRASRKTLKTEIVLHQSSLGCRRYPSQTIIVCACGPFRCAPSRAKLPWGSMYFVERRCLGSGWHVSTLQPLTLLARDDMIIFNCIGLTLLGLVLPGWRALPAFNGRGLFIMLLLHASVAEWLYYWLHQALHHHWLVTRYHSHHHQSFVTEPISGTYARRCCRRK